ncbi:GDSL esterase/lipase EXL6 [Madurella mycetomatis]|uniref:GDSL esterase/lipase EXL6 n=1 Tax=Madurella mycetomatis TaxID=100816 RepID=A0A175WEY4_9PEZI|nr:GDSL esterase/lipase EXL6 [Madurella mycetomatis]
MLLPWIIAGSAVAAVASDRCRAPKDAFDTLVTFGDSWTDNGRLGYYINNGGSAPAAGEYHPVTNTTASGGLSWAQFAAQRAGANLVDYAISGGTCSKVMIDRYFSPIDGPFPSVIEDGIPSFQADIDYETIFPNRTARNTVYALWIGTNDLGAGAFLTDAQAPGATISDYVDCVWSVFDAIYETGGRRFVLFNVAPLELLPMYAPPQNGGTLDSQFWANKTLYNMTEYNQKIKQYATSANTMFEYGVAFHAVVKSRWPEAVVDLFDVHSLLTDVYRRPAEYLDAPHNATGYWHHCSSLGADCVDQIDLGPLSGFMWYDELHPSTKTSSVVAKHFLDVVGGKSEYGTRYS